MSNLTETPTEAQVEAQVEVAATPTAESKGESERPTTQTSTTETGTTYRVGAVYQVDPATLLLERNIRDAQPSADLVKSVKAKGVLEPITAVLTAEGALLVRLGHRRTLAAIEAKVQAVPVYVAGTDDLADASEVDRIISQRDENTHRTGLTARDEIGVVEQLAAFGLSAAQVAKQARIKRRVVDAALTVAGSQTARSAAETWEGLTLDQAAVVAEFENDEESIDKLMRAARTGQFDHVAQRIRDDKQRARLLEDATAALAETGVTMVDSPTYDDKTVPVERLRNISDGKAVSAVDHAANCPGHVVWLTWGRAWVDAEGNIVDPNDYDYSDDHNDDHGDEDSEEFGDGGEFGDQGGSADGATEPGPDPYEGLTEAKRYLPVPGCSHPTKHGHYDSYRARPKPKPSDLPPEEREAASVQRKLVIENNKAWESAQTVRREWLTGFLKRKTAPKGTGGFLATTMAYGGGRKEVRDGHRLATVWVTGAEKAGWDARELAEAATGASEGRATVLALAQMLAWYEVNIDKGTWRQDGTGAAHGRYLRFLQANGYTLSEVEEYAISDQTA